MAGFSRDDQELVASLIRLLRRKLALGKEAPKPSETVIRMAVLLRLAVLLNRARSHKPLPSFGIHAVGDKVVLSFPADWLADQPLTAADLAQEALDLKDAGITLEVSRSRARPIAG
jgi:exopolyphosphatase/guanosine-5'-triphosphate,3'-diphosphate pyrophosphatase